jgi:dTDP-glucose pyrophosphorylase
MDVIILNGDSIFDKDDLKSILEYPGYAALVKKVDTPEKYGIFEVNQDNVIQKITEKPPLFI